MSVGGFRTETRTKSAHDHEPLRQHLERAGQRWAPLSTGDEAALSEVELSTADSAASD